jgi:hypothetical protein
MPWTNTAANYFGLGPKVDMTGEATPMLEALAKLRSLQTTTPEAPANLDELRGLKEAIWDLSPAVKAEREAIDRLVEKWRDENPGHCLGGEPRMYDYGGRGTDTIPAMLSPGEMVINAVSARQFSAQLIAMNAGIQPVFRSSGGQTTNIGDVNVTVNGGESSRQTARSIATELRRELRRGISTL